MKLQTPEIHSGISGSHNLTMTGVSYVRWFLMPLLIALSWDAITCNGLQPPVHVSAGSTRRGFLGRAAFSLASASSLLIPGVPAADAAVESGIPLMAGGTASVNPVIQGDYEFPALSTKLGRSRIQALQLSPVQQMPWDDQELYYAPFMFGAWDVTATLKRKTFPYGTSFVPSRSLLEGSPRNREERVGNTVSYQVHYFSTLANQATVNLELGAPNPKVIQDRSFNAKSISTAYQQLTPVQDVDWDYRKDPTKVVLSFGAGPLADDMRPLGQRRTEIFLTARQTETIAKDGDSYYATAELSRSVSLSPGNVVVSETESIAEFQKVTDDHVTAVSRMAVYLTPNPNSREGVMWQQVGGKAVAFYDYEIDMVRRKEELVLADGSKEARACVKTPKDVLQCY